MASLGMLKSGSTVLNWSFLSCFDEMIMKWQWEVIFRSQDVTELQKELSTTHSRSIKQPEIVSDPLGFMKKNHSTSITPIKRWITLFQLWLCMSYIDCLQNMFIYSARAALRYDLKLEKLFFELDCSLRSLNPLQPQPPTSIMTVSARFCGDHLASPGLRCRYFSTCTCRYRSPCRHEAGTPQVNAHAHTCRLASARVACRCVFGGTNWVLLLVQPRRLLSGKLCRYVCRWHDVDVWKLHGKSSSDSVSRMCWWDVPDVHMKRGPARTQSAAQDFSCILSAVFFDICCCFYHQW